MAAHYYKELLNFCARNLRDRAAAADLVQEAYARLLGAQQAGAAIGNPRALLFRTTRNLLTDQHRRAEVRNHASLDTLPEDDQPPAPAHLQPDEVLDASQYAKALHAEILRHLAVAGCVVGVEDRWGATINSNQYVKGTAATWSESAQNWTGPSTAFAYTQAGYAVWNAMVEYRVNPHWQVALNGNNLFDKWYYRTVGSSTLGNYYGEPRNWMLTLRGIY